MPLTKSGLWVPPPGRQIQRKNPTRSLVAPDGRRYEICPMCSARASLRTETADDTIWNCERCGYRDSATHGALN